ncbi:MAG: hypothetical protein LBJ08_00620 [Bifidobacteriaceae bacterium]|jgi:hypothetical protein|nr:hypothetical protein [Bifidobacteriaceae bacterium]
MASIARIAQAGADAQDFRDNPFREGTRAYWAVQDTLFEKFMATHDQCIEELQRLVRANGGPDLDGSVESLEPLNDWLKYPPLTGAEWDDGCDWRPTWAHIGDPDRRGPGGMDLLQYFRVEGRVAFYYADVLISQLPGSKWVCWREMRFNGYCSGLFVLDIGTFPTGVFPLLTVGDCIDDSWRANVNPAHASYSSRGEHTLMNMLQRDTSLRMDWLLEGKELDFQAAPTGRSAGINRGPYKGSRIKARWEAWYYR